ncbi:NAD(P)/FAD-dependent oxidoreductase [Cesiribacter andamanensis]|uniref:Hydroxyglutarate oxidase n=1 Tax=Cesiribacter andamanensis AMV16 TaxID=1279009 RepID=M7N904_9BACT|nr:FAD-dependent oxidoreductase [Cesiribacter andamanensis]EMR03732.1 hydroxyglutarate oxidase [Cesiribacter andamanensis AMV16]
MLSFWESERFVRAEYIIIGGGITGLSTAIELKESRPSARVLVLERGVFPSGASTRNAGFACFGSLTELLVDRQAMGDAAALQLVEERWLGLQKLRRRLGDAAMGYYQWGGYELIRRQELGCLEQLQGVNDWLKPLFGKALFQERKDLLQPFGFARERVETLIYNPLEGQVHTGQMMQALAALARARGVEVLTGVAVDRLEEEAGGVAVVALDPVRQSELRFFAEKVAVCTNAFARQLLPGLDLQPGRGQVLVTEPLDVLPFKGVFHLEEGYYYFRNIGRRLMLGGGRNLDFTTETTTQLQLNEQIQQALDQLLQEVILPGRRVPVAQRWSGIMAFGPIKQPLMQLKGERMAIGVRLGGMGVAIGSRLGQRLAAGLLKN